jgi:acyl dehydratase
MSARPVTGRWFEQLEVGTVVQHATRRTVTETDNVLFTTMTMNPAPLHLDVEYAKTLPYGRPLVNSLFTVALIGGMTVPELVLRTSLGNLGYTDIQFPKPVFHGDTLRAETTIVDKRESTSDSTRGIVWFDQRGYNQRDECVCITKRTGMIMRKPAGED